MHTGIQRPKRGTIIRRAQYAHAGHPGDAMLISISEPRNHQAGAVPEVLVRVARYESLSLPEDSASANDVADGPLVSKCSRAGGFWPL
jgi:hypothetical protein